MLAGFLSLANTILPRRDTQHGYPLDLDGSLRYTRPYQIDMYPYPPIVGCVSGFMRESSQFVGVQKARTQFGPAVNNLPNYSEMGIAVKGLTKSIRGF